MIKKRINFVKIINTNQEKNSHLIGKIFPIIKMNEKFIYIWVGNKRHHFYKKHCELLKIETSNVVLFKKVG